jgi:hypothetical protein
VCRQCLFSGESGRESQWVMRSIYDPFLPSQEEKDAAQRLLMTLDAQKHCVYGAGGCFHRVGPRLRPIMKCRVSSNRYRE